MLTCQNAEGVHGQRKVGNPCTSSMENQVEWEMSVPAVRRVDNLALIIVASALLIEMTLSIGAFLINKFQKQDMRLHFRLSFGLVLGFMLSVLGHMTRVTH